MNDYDRLLETIRKRRSVRRFSDRAVGREDIARLLEAARWAPSNHNRQPWRFLVVEDKQQINRLVETVSQGLSEKLKALPEVAAVYAGEFTHYATFFAEAPALIVVMHKQPVSVSLPLLAGLKNPGLVSGEPLSAAMAVQNILLAAQALGLGTCVLTGPLLVQDALAGALYSRRSRPHLPGGSGTPGGGAGGATEENHRANRRVQDQPLDEQNIHMTKQEIFEELKPLLVEVLGVTPETIRLESVLVSDLGAESIDLLDLSFRIEEKFQLRIEANEIEREAKKRLPGGAYEKDGYLTEAALDEIRKSLPELDAGKLVRGLRKVDLPALLTVSFFVHLIARKLADKMEGVVHA